MVFPINSNEIWAETLSFFSIFMVEIPHRDFFEDPWDLEINVIRVLKENKCGTATVSAAQL